MLLLDYVQMFSVIRVLTEKLIAIGKGEEEMGGGGSGVLFNMVHSSRLLIHSNT